jgi:hypothetical protein
MAFPERQVTRSAGQPRAHLAQPRVGGTAGAASRSNVCWRSLTSVLNRPCAPGFAHVGVHRRIYAPSGFGIPDRRSRSREASPHSADTESSSSHRRSLHLFVPANQVDEPLVRLEGDTPMRRHVQIRGDRPVSRGCRHGLREAERGGGRFDGGNQGSPCCHDQDERQDGSGPHGSDQGAHQGEGRPPDLSRHCAVGAARRPGHDRGHDWTR